MFNELFFSERLVWFLGNERKIVLMCSENLVLMSMSCILEFVVEGICGCVKTIEVSGVRKVCGLSHDRSAVVNCW